MAQGVAATQRWGKNSKRKESMKESMSGDTGGAPSQTPRTSLLPSSSSQEPETLQQQQLVALAGSVQKLTELVQTQQKELTRLTTLAAAPVAAAAVATAPVAAAAVAAAAAAAAEEEGGVSDSHGEGDEEARPADDTWAQGRTPPSGPEDEEQELA